ncbi:fatty acid desaturase [Henriciella aquimarina]|uniref:fatty acid desaturase n=1 Tax=Henriciella aquimarina TaxID=545261 RepID=UPI000A009729|nr:fatty acid desaturase [Henriciella aquimarina]
MSERDLTLLSPTELARLERDIARQHIGKFPWLVVIGSFANLAVWLSLWPLVFMGVLPVWAGLLIATINATLSYLASHEAQHDIIARPGSKLYWLNEAVGHLSTIPLALPYSVAKATHLEHHRHTNHPELDPDISSRARGPWHAIWRSIQNRQPRGEGAFNAYARTLIRLKKIGILREAALYRLTWFATLIALAWSGHAIEAAALWWLPHHLAYTYIQFFLSWAPHHPANETARYRTTRSFRSVLGNLGSFGMQYHIVHHLHPRIPLYRTPMAYWQMKPILLARGADVHSL